MILGCPNCSTKFRVPDNAIGPDGRVVKCAKCAHSWKAMGQDALPEQQQPRRRPAPAPRRAVQQRAPVQPRAPMQPRPVQQRPVQQRPVQQQPIQQPVAPPPPPVQAAPAPAAPVAETPPPPPAAPAPEPVAAPPAPEPVATPEPAPAPAQPSKPVTDVGVDADAIESALQSLVDSVDARERGEGADADDIAPPADMGTTPDLSADLPMDPPPVMPRNLKVKRVVKKKTRSPLGAWIGLIVILLIIAANGFFFMRDIVHAFPPSKKIYTMFGLEPDILGYGLELPDPEFEIEKDGDNTSLIINGVVNNTTSETVKVPVLRGALTNTAEEEVLVWTYEADSLEALPGEAVTYSTRIENPPPGLVGMVVTFATREEAKMLMDSKKDSDEMPNDTMDDNMSKDESMEEASESQ